LPDDQSGTAPCGDDQPPESAVVRKNENPTTENSQTKSQDQTKDSTNEIDRLMVKWTRAVALLTGALFIAALLQFCAMKGQQNVMQGQLDAMEADQRPWISMAGPPKIASELTLINKDWARVSLAVPIKNTGKSPARNVAVLLKVVGFPRDVDLLSEQQRFCAKSNQPLPPGAKYIGLTVFPGDQYETRQFANALPDEITEMRANHNQKRAIVSGIVGCINYQFIADENIHQTGIILDFLRKIPTQETNFGIDLDTAPIQPGDLNVTLSPFGSGPAY
jgi:hypothetical protein